MLSSMFINMRSSANSMRSSMFISSMVVAHECGMEYYVDGGRVWPDGCTNGCTHASTLLCTQARSLGIPALTSGMDIYVGMCIDTCRHVLRHAYRHVYRHVLRHVYRHGASDEACVELNAIRHRSRR